MNVKLDTNGHSCKYLNTKIYFQLLHIVTKLFYFVTVQPCQVKPLYS